MGPGGRGGALALRPGWGLWPGGGRATARVCAQRGVVEQASSNVPAAVHSLAGSCCSTWRSPARTLRGGCVRRALPEHASSPIARLTHHCCTAPGGRVQWQPAGSPMSRACSRLCRCWRRGRSPGWISRRRAARGAVADALREGGGQGEGGRWACARGKGGGRMASHLRHRRRRWLAPTPRPLPPCAGLCTPGPVQGLP